MSRINIPTLVLFLVLLAIIDVQCQRAENFTRSFSLLVTSKSKMLTAMKSIKANVDQYESVQRYIQALEDLERNVKEFLNAKMPSFMSGKDDLPKVNDAVDIYLKSLKLGFDSNYEFKNVLNFWETVAVNINSKVSNGDVSDFVFLGYCNALLSFPSSVTDISSIDVCKSSLSCVQKKKTYIKNLSVDYKNTCTDDKKCRIDEALPLMAIILWYEVDFIILQKVCHYKCSTGKCNNNVDVLREIRLSIAYANIHPKYFVPSWNTFFSDFLAKKGFTEIELALSVIEKHLKHFETAHLSCTTLKYDQACPYSDILENYKRMKGDTLKKNKKRLVKDLRLYAQMDHAKMIEVQKDGLSQLEVLASIKVLDGNVKEYVSGIANYLQGVAKFDEGIANADVAFIKGQLDMYEKQTSVVQEQMLKKLKRAMGLMMGVLTTNLAEKITQLAFLVVKQANPFKAIFSGPDLEQINEKLGEVADATSQIVKGSTLMKSLTELTQDSLKLYKGFNENKDQLSSLETVVNKIKNGQSSNIGKDSTTFIEQYNSYTPKVSRSEIAKNNALWSAFKEATCALLEGEVGIGGAVPKSIAGSELICERLEGVMAQFFTLREDIFNFQFQLVESVTSVIRANIKQRLAKEIIKKGNDLPGAELILSYFVIHGKLQAVSSLYCDVLEYKNQGNSVAACKKINRFFTKANLDFLISYKDTSPYTQVEVEAFIPTRASFPGDTGYINLAALGRGEDVIFKIPANDSWLQNYKWLLAESPFVPFVEDLEVYFPHTAMAGGVLTTTQVKISSIAGNSFSTKNTDESIQYMLPSSHGSFRNVYEEGYHHCSNEIENPYSLCNNLPKICDTSQTIASYSIRPTVLSTWKIRLIIQQGSKEVTWYAPSPATHLLIRAKAKLRIPTHATKQGPSPLFSPLSINNYCCAGNKYRKSPYIPSCQPCPGKSKSRYRGLYCEIASTKLLIN